MPGIVKSPLQIAAPLVAILMAGCGFLAPNNHVSSNQSGAGVLSSLRPGANPAIVDRLNQEEYERLQKQLAQQSQASQADGLASRVLPKVSMDPIAPPAEQVSPDGAIITNAQDTTNSNNNQTQ